MLRHVTEAGHRASRVMGPSSRKRPEQANPQRRERPAVARRGGGGEQGAVTEGCGVLLWGGKVSKLERGCGCTTLSVRNAQSRARSVTVPTRRGERTGAAGSTPAQGQVRQWGELAGARGKRAVVGRQVPVVGGAGQRRLRGQCLQATGLGGMEMASVSRVPRVFGVGGLCPMRKSLSASGTGTW